MSSPRSCIREKYQNPPLSIQKPYWLVVSNIWIIFHVIYGIIYLPIEDLHDFSRWLLHHQPPTSILYKPPKIHHLVNHGESTNDLAASPLRAFFETRPTWQCRTAWWSQVSCRSKNQGQVAVGFGRALGIGKWYQGS